MIRFWRVDGEVLVDDRTRCQSRLATMGLELDSAGDYLIATTHTSSASVEVNGKTINLGPRSFLRVRGNQSWWDRHSEVWVKDFKRAMGRLWARIERHPREKLLGGGGGGGIRG